MAYSEKFVFPISDVIGRFAELTGPMQTQVDFLANQINQLRQLQTTLLPRLFSGELQLRQAEKLVEEVA